MGAIKESVVDMIRSLPEDCTLEDIHYHLYVREKVEQGIRAIDEGMIVSQEEAEQRVQTWLKSSGRSRL
ncbi:MAG: hypothetical protein AUJ92_16450 [Armatimonadetes bacterium CG2_30_59_28]|nr:hypothetical protein [Armatimonadota bacterium]OIO91504.1 MAG: hypothetical protein AUJ92_16450 [Armatimonadetes bacterium CG2_30_59_28]PIU65937.1 MAG: hypothetical protein COS85_06575 [Armatimonadetes bacterium CG07_land_8_20_14_0_80_59_28]PIX40838.1 MAG: hypothetical protein COZ56_13680 [Armatimonadetes bacterium CG_4_8_14_3_um_filter_58_9]PIY43318.1 MAG: hypothetical protein COZ05_11465 [Armatimonadetes bacterium CG_4_10_14_3_um_filter_59_10]PJB63735.1 MAG: hypothetical protein CO095_158